MGIRHAGSGGQRAARIALMLLAVAPSLAAVVPSEITGLIKAGKLDEASRRVYEMMPQAGEAERLELAHVVYDKDPDLARLKHNLRSWVVASNAGEAKSGLARLLGQLALSQRDFETAQWAYAQVPDDSGASLLSAGLSLLLGRNADSKQALVDVLRHAKDSAVIEKASCLLAWLVWSEGQGKTGLEILANKKSPPALYLTAVIARSLGLKKDDQAARERLAKDAPHSVWSALAEPDADPALQVDMTLLILTGIGVAAAGDASRSGFASVVTPVAPKSAIDDSPARAIQVGYFSDNKNAQKLSGNLNAKGFMAQVEEDKANKRYKVLVLIRPGQDPENLVLQLKDIGMEGILVF